MVSVISFSGKSTPRRTSCLPAANSTCPAPIACSRIFAALRRRPPGPRFSWSRTGATTPRTIPSSNTFPPHCIKGTPGSALVPEALAEKVVTVPNEPTAALPRDLFRYQQIHLEKQTLDIFESRHAAELVKRLGDNTEFVVFGVATEYCVRLAAKGLLERGHRVAVVKDAIETLKTEGGQRTVAELQALGARFITTDQALARLDTVLSRTI